MGVQGSKLLDMYMVPYVPSQQQNTVFQVRPA